MTNVTVTNPIEIEVVEVITSAGDITVVEVTIPGPQGAAAVGGGSGSGDIEDVTAGAGLTGGGSSGSVTLDVGAGTGITVNANDVALTVPVAVSSGGTGQTTEAEAIGEMTQALTADATPDPTTDYVPTYDASADTGKKVLLNDLITATESQIETVIDTLANLTSIQGRTVTLADAGADAVLGWDDSADAYENLTAAEVVAIISTADGSGSGLDADLLDGKNTGTSGNAVPLLDGTNTWSGLQTFNSQIAFQDAEGILDDSGNELLIFQKQASAANYLEIENTVTGTFPIIRAAGSDADIGITFYAKGNITGGLAAFEFILGDGEGAEVLIQNTAPGGSGPILNIQNYSASPAVSDEVGAIYFGSKDSAGPGHQVYGTISSTILDATSGNEDGETVFKTALAGAIVTGLKIANGVIIGTGTTYPGAGNLRVTNIELGNDTDTTLSRAAAGALAVEGVRVAMCGKQTIWIPAVAMTARTTNGAASGSTEVSPNLIMLKTLDFDTTTQEFAQFTVCLPKSWDHGTLTFVPVWSHASTTVNFGVAWGLAGVAIGDDDDAVQPFGAAVTSVDTGGTTNNIYEGPESSAITITGDSPMSDAEFCTFQINRTVSDGGDTLGIDARLHGIKLFYTTNVGNDA